MDLFTLKIIGIITMFMDHYNYIIGGPGIFDILGRIAFPIFAFALVEGYKHTRDIRKYFLRIGLSAILFQIPIWILKYETPLNIFFTLFFGLLCIYIFDNYNFISKILILPVIIFAILIEIDYGIYGILLIICFYAGYNNKYIRIILPLLLNIWIYFSKNLFGIDKIQVCSVLALIPIYFYNGKKGKNMKYFFYVFYPAHFLVIELIKKLFVDN